MDGQQGRDADLDWIAGILSQPPIEASVTRSDPGEAGGTVETFGVFPTAAHPRLLVPLESKRAAAALLRGGSHAREPHVRLGRALLRTTLRVGIAQQILRDRLTFAPASGKAVPPDLADVLLCEHLAGVFERRDLSFGVRVGRVRPNRKPLIQVVSREGDLLGYVKVGWNALTRGLVAHEAEVLQALERGVHSTFAAPRVLHHGRWHELELLALSPLEGSLVRPHQRLDDVAEAMLEITRLSDAEERRLSESAYWQSTQGRIGALSRGADVAELADRLEARWGSEALTFGSWHGDWTPWNMAWRDGALIVWDWERSGPRIPLGLDGAHFDFQVALSDARRDWQKALPKVLSAEGKSLPLPPGAGGRRLLVALDLLEMALRAAEGRQAGITSHDAIYVPALRALLE
jgi:Phosphotransferase enzyme family